MYAEREIWNQSNHSTGGGLPTCHGGLSHLSERAVSQYPPQHFQYLQQQRAEQQLIIRMRESSPGDFLRMLAKSDNNSHYCLAKLHPIAKPD